MIRRGFTTRRIIIIALIIVAAVLGGFLLSQIQFSSQTYKIDDYNRLWNQSLGDLSSGNISMIGYCAQPVHDENICNQFMNLRYMD